MRLTVTLEVGVNAVAKPLRRLGATGRLDHGEDWDRRPLDKVPQHTL
jgi:hypothetical protein